MTDMSAIGWSRGRRGRARADRPSRPGRHAGSRGREAVTIISAPAGSGKTSLLHAWAGRARTTGSPSCPYGRASATRSCSSSRCGRGPRQWGPSLAMDKRPDVLWNPCIRSLLSPGSGTASASSRGRSRVRIGRDQSVHIAQAAITDRDDIDPADYRLTGRPDTPRQRGSVGPNVGGPSSSCTKPARGPSSSF